MSDLKQGIARIEQELASHTEEVTKQLAEMKAQLKQGADPYGWLARGVSYYYLTSAGGLKRTTWDGPGVDFDRLALGNVYQTMEEAGHALNRQKAKAKIVRALRKHEGDWVGDWNDTNQNKFYPSYEHYRRQIAIFSTGSMQSKEAEMYSSKEAWRWVLDNLEAEVKLYLGVNND